MSPVFVEKNEKPLLILASASPRRQELLASLDLPFQVLHLSYTEEFSEKMPVFEVPAFLACQKAAAYTALSDNEILITADTVVIIDQTILGKPKNLVEAASFLKKLSGRKHEVVTGVCIKTKKKQVVFTEKTSVFFTVLDSSRIAHHLSLGGALDKAGAYGIQDWLGKTSIVRIEGDYYNVMGLPLHQLYTHLQEFL